MKSLSVNGSQLSQRGQKGEKNSRKEQTNTAAANVNSQGTCYPQNRKKALSRKKRRTETPVPSQSRSALANASFTRCSKVDYLITRSRRTWKLRFSLLGRQYLSASCWIWVPIPKRNSSFMIQSEVSRQRRRLSYFWTQIHFKI